MKIEIFSDSVCPWCRIGKQNLQEALKQWNGKEQVTIRWRAFQLDPSIPSEGMPFLEALEHKFGSDEARQEAFGHVCRVGEACGLPFQFEQIERMPNTLRSHMLVKIAPPELQNQLAEAIMEAYFSQGKDIGDLSTLSEIAEECGMDKDIVYLRLERNEGLAEVEEDLEFAARAGIRGVPYFILNDRYALTGAQPVQAFLMAFDRLKDSQ